LLTSIVKTNAKAAAPAFQSCSNKIKAQSNARLLNICPERPPQISFAGHGCGFGHNMDDDCSYAQQRKLHALFVGGPAPTVPPLNAEWLLKWYSAFANTDSENELLDGALAAAAALPGPFAFVLFDGRLHRLLVARDASGDRPLFWGATPGGQLLLGSRLDDLAACEPTATEFPPGCLFAVHRHGHHEQPGDRGWVIDGEEMPGTLVSFVAHPDAAHFRAVAEVPRLTGDGCVTGAVYKVSSKPDMQHEMKAR